VEKRLQRDVRPAGDLRYGDQRSPSCSEIADVRGENSAFNEARPAIVRAARKRGGKTIPANRPSRGRQRSKLNGAP